MPIKNGSRHRSILQNIAHRVMNERGLLPDFNAAAISELSRINRPATQGLAPSRDLRSLLWCSIDNDDSRDLDQLTVAESMPGGNIKVFVAIADVDALVGKASALDEHARHNTTSVYTAAEIFPLLPEKLSTNLTSLNFDCERIAIVVEMLVAADGTLAGSDIYGANVRNHAKLCYGSVGSWLEGEDTIPADVAAVTGLEENLRLQDKAAQRLKSLRYINGALNFETIKARPKFEGDELKDMVPERKNRARDLIENFMVSANGITARFLASRKFPSLRRVVRTPKRWERIVELALERGFSLPEEPDSKVLEKFLESEKAADPIRFPDLSLSVIKLLGPGEYVVELPGKTSSGHFGLAVKDYNHSTAPNRRYPDIITHRLLKAAKGGRPVPYQDDELEALAKHCTSQEDAAKKVERQVGKSATALLLENRIGERFDAIVTGASEKGTWVRIMNPPVEGRLIGRFESLDVGRSLRVQLLSTDVERGYIDFKEIPS